jgi:hypothetical protein
MPAPTTRENNQASKPLHIRDGRPYFAWRSGDTDSARRMMEKNFERFLSTDTKHPVAGNFYTLEYLQLLIHHGFFREAATVFNRIEDIWNPIKEHFYTLDKILTFSVSQSEIDVVDDERERLFINLPAWGDKYLDVCEQGLLPALAAPAAAFLFEEMNVELHIFTRSIDRPRLLRMPAIRQLESRATIRWFNLDTVLIEHQRRGLDAMNIAQWCSLTLARQKSAGLLLLLADSIYGEGGLPTLAREIRGQRNDILYMLDLPMTGDAWSALSDVSLNADGAARVPSEKLIALFSTHKSNRERSWTIYPEDQTIPVNPVRLSLSNERYTEIRTLYPQPIYLSANALGQFFAHTPMFLDRFSIETADAALGGTERMRILNDPEQFVCATFDFNASVDKPDVVAAVNPIGETLEKIAKKQLITAARHWAFRQPLILGKKSQTNVLDRISEEFLAHRTEDCGEMSAYLRFCHEILIPSFISKHPRVTS